MIKGIGIDIIELDRMKKIKKRDRFLHRILSERELKEYESLKNEQRKIEYVAGRFAAKEAFSKAVGTGIGKLQFKQIEILKQSSGAPKIIVDGYHAEQLFISISHSRDYAIAQVIITEK